MPQVGNTGRAGRNAGFMLLLTGAVLLLAGCGGDDKDPAPPPRALVPAAMQDSATVDTLQAVADTAAAAARTDVPVIRETVVETPSAAAAPPPAKAKPNPPPPAVAENLGPYSLQLGSFRTEANARSRLKEIQELGYNPAVEKADIGGTAYFRVVLRGLETREKAGAIGEKIRSALDIEYLVRRTD